MAVTQTQIAVAVRQCESRIVRIQACITRLALDLAELWAYRELLYFFVWRDIKVRYKQKVIGTAWAILQQVVTMIVFSLFFGKLAKPPSQSLPYPISYYSALLPWMYFATAVRNDTSILSGKHVVFAKSYFPQIILLNALVLSGF